MSDSNAHQVLFSQIPEEVLYADISDGAYRLYGALARIVDSHERVGFVLIKTLAKRLNRSESSVKRHLKELTDTGLVVSQQQWVDGQGRYHTHYEAGWRQTANIYTLPMEAQAGSKPEPPVKSEPREGVNADPPGGVKTERGAGPRNDLQYDSPSIPEPLNPRENPLGNVPLSSAGRLFVVPDENQGDEDSTDDAKERAIDAAFAALGRKRNKAS